MESNQYLVSKVKFHIYGHGRGWCFTKNDFLSLGQADAIRQVLSRLDKAGFIRRVSWGLYEYPRKHQKLGILPPDIQQVVQAVARKEQIRVLASGALAANLLGLSNQVPARVVYLTEGVSKRLRIGKQEIVFKKTTPKIMATAGTFAGLVIQAFKHLGSARIDQTVMAKLKKQHKRNDLLSLIKYKQYAPVWIQKIFQTLTEEL